MASSLEMGGEEEEGREKQRGTTKRVVVDLRLSFECCKSDLEK